MATRFPGLSTAAAIDLETEYLGEIRRAVSVQPPSVITVHGIELDGSYPDTEAVVNLTDSRDGVNREMRFELWGDDCQESYEIPQSPPHLATLLVTTVFEEAAC